MISQKEYYKRIEKIPDLIRQVADNNIVVYRLCQSYTHGDIITWEEALCQMVVHLTRDWKKEHDNLIKTMMLGVAEKVNLMNSNHKKGEL